MSWLTFVILTLAAWRITRFIILDDLIGGTRQKIYDRLESRPQPGEPDYEWDKLRNFLAFKAWLLLRCPWCVGVYVSAGVLLTARLFVLESIPMPVFTWLAISALLTVPYNYLDGE